MKKKKIPYVRYQNCRNRLNHDDKIRAIQKRISNANISVRAVLTTTDFTFTCFPVSLITSFTRAVVRSFGVDTLSISITTGCSSSTFVNIWKKYVTFTRFALTTVSRDLEESGDSLTLHFQNVLFNLTERYRSSYLCILLYLVCPCCSLLYGFFFFFFFLFGNVMKRCKFMTSR